MKLRIIYTTFSLFFLVFLSLSNSGGRADSSNWGNTGAPGDQALNNGRARTCQSCHSNGDIQVTLGVEILGADNTPITAYTPNETYTAKVSINPAAGTPNGYGFQMVSLFDGDDSDVNGWLEAGHSDNVKISTANNTGRVYAEHKGVSNTNEFLVQWKAPAAGSGDISFYAAGNGVNGNGSSSGDGAATPQKLTLSESSLSAIKDLSSIGIDITIAPNRVKDQLILNIDSSLKEKIDIQLLNTNGQVFYSQSKNLFQGKTIDQLDISHLTKGVYFLQVATSQAITTKKVIKL